ncbi:histidine phosphatase family protein [Nocardioides sp. Leaf374]|uniref:histidine phosphatase family protein n=1 Tax=Nocardioides sp. Leaf374 TaxID=2876560 RepID=UPI001E4ECFB9|nr:histidine phosphatase family protein [Nocardioides sp. Leaf374]
MAVHLVRHARPLVEPGRPPHTWGLDPAGFDEVWALRESGRLPRRAAWLSSPEPKAVGTAQLLTDGEVAVLDGLREHVRESTQWLEDFPAVVRRAFAAPDESAHPGWEPLAACRERVVRAVDAVLADHDGDEVVLVGHGTAWTLVAAHLRGEAPDLDRWEGLGMPDVIRVDDPRRGPQAR